MGQANCKSCCSDYKPELELRNSFIPSSFVMKNKADEMLATQHSEMPNKVIRSTHLYTEERSQVAAVKIQSVWKAIRAKVQFKQIRRHSRPPYRYFSIEEVKETLSDVNTQAAFHDKRQPYRYRTGGVYVGQWLGGFRDGWGVMIWANDAKYEGFWSYGRPNGEGRFTLQDGRFYEGKWSRPNAFGKESLCKTGEGWQTYVKDGYEWLWYIETTSRIPSIDEQIVRLLRAVGEIAAEVETVAKNARHFTSFSTVGRKVQEIVNSQCKYVGETLGDVKDGYGKQTWANGDTYEGQWKNDRQNGWGVNKWDDGSCFVGNYVQDIKEGVGQYDWEDGTRFIGVWKDNAMHGYGTYSWPDGRSYQGDWRDNLMQGFGIYTHADGKRYEGGWYEGKKHGIGSVVYPDQRRVKGKWHMGEVVKP